MMNHRFLRLQELEVGRREVSDGDGGNALDEDDDNTILLDTLDDTFCPGEVAVDDTDTLRDLVEEVGVLQIDQVVAHDRGNSDEVVHLDIRHHDDLRTVRRHRRPMDHILHVGTLFVEHLQTGDLLL